MSGKSNSNDSQFTFTLNVDNISTKAFFIKWIDEEFDGVATHYTDNILMFILLSYANTNQKNMGVNSSQRI